MRTLLISLIFLLGTSASAAHGQPQWTSKSNWMTELSHDELVTMMGSLEEPGLPLDTSDALVGQKSYESLDWRNVNGINWLGPVLNQGNCGSCVAFAATATLEATMSIASGMPWLNPSLSPQALFSCGGGSCGMGWYPSSATRALKRKGTVDLACAPYLSGSTGEDVSCHEFCSNQSDRTYKIIGSTHPTWGWGNKISKVKEALKKGPLMTTMTVYEDFISYSSGIYKSNGRHRLGGHAVSIVGFNDQGRYWIIRNSWGTDWGENGFARISWDDPSGIGSSTYGFQVDAAKTPLAITTPAANAYIAGETALTVRSKAPRGNLDLSFKLRSENSRAEEALSCAGSAGTCLQKLDSSKLADGRYELWAEGTDGKTKSIIQTLTVLNNDPNFAVSIKPEKVDLSRPVSDRIEFDVKTQTASVPPQLVDLVVKKPDGTVAITKSYNVVLPQMKLGFRTNTLPNGKYELYYRVSALNYAAESKHYSVQIAN